MKTKSPKLPLIVMLTILSCFSCQKESLDSKQNELAENSRFQASVNDAATNSCRLAYWEWETQFTQAFHYNDKGLADIWTVDYGSDLVITNAMVYDQHNRLISSHENFFGSPYEYTFAYSGDLLTGIKRAAVENPADVQDWHLTYNSRGQNTAQDDEITDSHVRNYFDEMGNTKKAEIYFGDELWFSISYTFTEPVRNPHLNVPGVTIGFPFYGGTYFSDKRILTSNRTLLYDQGVEYVLDDYDPSQTTVQKGNHDFPYTVNYYDRISGSSIGMTYDYENCNGRTASENAVSAKNWSFKSNRNLNTTLLLKGNPTEIKERVRNIVRQIKTDKL